MVASTLVEHAFDLRSGLREAAKTSLKEFETMISDIGYGWLDGYMEGVMEGPYKYASSTPHIRRLELYIWVRNADVECRNSIHELMKTPSRTQTVKKTRAITTAAKDRTEKVKRMNALSPLSKASPVCPPSSDIVIAHPADAVYHQARQPFSPLQPRSLNVPSPSALANTPTKGGKIVVKSMGENEKVVAKEKVAKGKPKVKKGKTKKIVEQESSMPPQEVTAVPPSTSAASPVDSVLPVLASSAMIASPTIPSLAQPTTTHIIQPLIPRKPDEVELQPVNVEPESTSATDEATVVVSIVEHAVIQREVTRTAIDLSMIVEGEEEASSRSISNTTNISSHPPPPKLRK